MEVTKDVVGFVSVGGIYYILFCYSIFTSRSRWKWEFGGLGDMWPGKKGREGREGENEYIRCEGLWEYEGAALERVLMKFWSNELLLG